MSNMFLKFGTNFNGQMEQMVSLAKWLSVLLRTKWMWVRIPLQSLKTVKDYYLKCDVLPLADVFENFRNNSLKNYGLCPSHYLSQPALSWDATVCVMM